MIDYRTLLDGAKKRVSIRDSLFHEQRLAVDDPSPRKCIWTTGRAGKSTAVLTEFTADAVENDHKGYFYFCLTEKQVFKIAWPILKYLDRTYKLKARFQEHLALVTYPNGSWIQLAGADRPVALDRFYGIRLRGAAFDEAGFYSSLDLREMINDTIGPRLVDDDGQCYIMSIPPRYPFGLFYEVIKEFPKRKNMAGVQSSSEPEWVVHSWTTHDNPAMRDKFKAEIARKKANDPDYNKYSAYIRNYDGDNVFDTGKLVYSFDPLKNIYHDKWEMLPGDRFILGMDLGWDDCTAFSFVTWRPTNPKPLLIELDAMKAPNMRMDVVESHVRSYMELVNQIDAELVIVCDYAHKQYFEELARRYSLPLMQSEKPKKYDWIQTVNSEFELCHIMLLADSTKLHQNELTTLPWKVMAQTGLRKELPGKPNDLCDAFLAAFRHAYHYIHKEKKEEVPKVGTIAYFKQQEERHIKQMESRLRTNKKRAWYE